MKPPAKNKRNNFKGRQMPVAYLAQHGLHAAAIQKVIRKWRGRIGIAACKHYVPACYAAMEPGSMTIQIALADESHKAYASELLAAFAKFFSDKNHPAPWVAQLCRTHCSFAEMQAEIQRRGGPKIAQSTLAYHASKMNLTGNSSASSEDT